MFYRLIAASAALAAVFAALPAAAQVFGGVQREEPLPRFQDPLCPGIAGLQVEAAEMVVGRIRENAESLGLPTDDPATCRANILVAVLADGKSYVNALRDRRPYVFEALDKRQREALFETAAPARSWVRVVTRTRDGMVVDRPEGLDIPPQAAMAMAHSRIYSAVRQDIISAGVLINASAMSGVSLLQLADYATMRALAGDSREAISQRGGSILALFGEDGAAPAELTEGDWIFLRTLYGTLDNNPAATTLAIAQRRIDEQVLVE
ncbi:MAG: hypothetical protein ACO1OD_13535 [Croceibacterium sp.]